MKCGHLIWVFLVLLVSVAAAEDFPDPSCCQVSLDAEQRLLLVPDGGGQLHLGRFTVRVINMYNCTTPMPNAIVEVIIGGQPGRVHLCRDQVTMKYSDEQGYTEFDITGGGCMKGEYALSIRVNGVEIRSYRAVVSPDYAGWDNEGMPNRWSLSMTPQDLAAFVAAYRGATGPASCHDYNNNGIVDAMDLSIFVKAYVGGSTACSP